MVLFAEREEIHKGWSGDKKYCVRDHEGTTYLLRVSKHEEFDKKQNEFRMMQVLEKLGIPMCKPISFGVSDEGVYSVQTWIDGEDAEEVIPRMRDAKQYMYGLKAGRILKQIHTVPAPDDITDWNTRFQRKLDRKIKGYTECPLKYEGGEFFLEYIENNRHLLQNRPQVYQHGDYHIGNMMIDTDGNLQIIDFNRNDYGDPWEEFNRIVWCAQASPLFASGMVDGYFDHHVPIEFWKLLALYIASNTLSSLYWAIPYGEDEILTMRNQAKEVLSWYRNMQEFLPTWYRNPICLQYLDGIPFLLQKPFDFGFLSKYGKVFEIFDDQDSGNICFGAEKDGNRYFVKAAGAQTAKYNGSPDDAIKRLKETVPIYENLRHRNLIEYIECIETDGCFAMVFDWIDGDCMGRKYPASHERFLSLSLADKLHVFDDLLSFFTYIAEMKYVAIDFYDGSILYDNITHRTTVCDVDFYRKQPTVNDMGRMWGSSLFQAPEEFVMGAVLDEITNVYTLGATAFALFGNYKRTQNDWQLSDALFNVVVKATCDDRVFRQQSIRQLKNEWNAARE